MSQDKTQLFTVTLIANGSSKNDSGTVNMRVSNTLTHIRCLPEEIESRVDPIVDALHEAGIDHNSLGDHMLNASVAYDAFIEVTGSLDNVVISRAMGSIEPQEGIQTTYFILKATADGCMESRLMLSFDKCCLGFAVRQAVRIKESAMSMEPRYDLFIPALKPGAEYQVSIVAYVVEGDVRKELYSHPIGIHKAIGG